MTRVLILKGSDGFGVFDVDAPAEEIVRAVNQGRANLYIPESGSHLLARQQADVVVITGEDDQPEENQLKISRREHEILVLLGEGLTTAQIAYQLQLSQRTIRGYVAKMKKRLEAQNIQQLVARAVELGLFHPEI